MAYGEEDQQVIAVQRQLQLAWDALWVALRAEDEIEI